MANANGYKPGVIYELRCNISGEWHPFYVGRTSRPDARLAEHQRDADNGNHRLVYHFIRQLDEIEITWNLFPVFSYDSMGPLNYEDQHILNLVLDGITLQNMKKGDSNWAVKQCGVSKTAYARHQKTVKELSKEKASPEEQLKEAMLWQDELRNGYKAMRNKAKYKVQLDALKASLYVFRDENRRVAGEKRVKKIKRLNKDIAEFKDNADRQGFVRQMLSDIKTLLDEHQALKDEDLTEISQKYYDDVRHMAWQKTALDMIDKGINPIDTSNW